MTSVISSQRPAAASDRNAEKVRANCAAQLAIQGGFTLHDMADGGFEIARWDRTEHCPDLAAVSRFLDRLGSAVAPLPASSSINDPRRAMWRRFDEATTT